uniref:Uncharacterized protein n=1 Tax=Solanum demissum TaxID=50514 RepID=A0A191UMR9_SOLDE|nr:hypothetical protein [Solanum demissum]
MIGVENHEVSSSNDSKDLSSRLAVFDFFDLSIGIVPYSPLGRGFFSAGAKLIEILPDGDFCKRASTGCPYLKSS